MRRRLRLGCRLLAAVLVAGGLGAAADSTRAGDAAVDDDRYAPASGGSLAGVFSGDLDLVGNLRVDLPFAVAPRSILFVRGRATTAIERATSLTFRVREVDYAVETGWRRGAPDRPGWSIVAGQLGRERVDADGQGFVRYVGAGWDSRSAYAPPLERGVSGSITLAAVVDDREVRADAVVDGSFLWRRPWRRAVLGFDLRTRGLVRFGNRFAADVETGPRLGFRFPGGRAFDAFVHVLRSRHPFGLNVDAVLVGLDVSEAGSAPHAAPSPPDVGGAVAAGGGDGRRAARLRVRALSPGFGHGLRAVLDVDANVLTASDTGELYYLYDAGIEHAGRDRVIGAWYYHRSNHQLAEPNDTITSINVIEVGAESDAWDATPPTGPTSRRGRFDWRLRGGWLVDSAFGEHVRWHARGGVRWMTPGRWGRVRPYVLGEAEAGDVSRRAWALGALTDAGVDARLEYRADDQYFGRDRTALLIMIGRLF